MPYMATDTQSATMFSRTKKTVGSETRHYYYNDEWRALEERVDGASTAVDRQYTWGVLDRWELVRRKRSTGGSSLNETTYCLRDYLDPVAITDGSGNVIERYAYDAFGPHRIMGPDWSTRTSSSYAWTFLFHAEFLDPDTSLYNYGYRYYHPKIGRWLSRDPWGETIGESVYAALGEAPTSKIDEYGLQVSPYPNIEGYPPIPPRPFDLMNPPTTKRLWGDWVCRLRFSVLPRVSGAECPQVDETYGRSRFRQEACWLAEREAEKKYADDPCCKKHSDNTFERYRIFYEIKLPGEWDIA